MTQSELKERFDYVDDQLVYRDTTRGKAAGTPAGCLVKVREGYRGYVTINRRRTPRARVVWVYHNGEIPKGLTVDHKNTDPTDDSIGNLRLATSSQQAINRRTNTRNTSGRKGVTWDKSRNYWKATICVNGVVTSLGASKDIEVAIRLREEAELLMFGEFKQ